MIVVGMQDEQPTQEDADEILLDVWGQYSHVVNKTHGRWAGGLSTLESVEAYLKQRGRLNAKGLPRGKVSAGRER